MFHALRFLFAHLGPYRRPAQFFVFLGVIDGAMYFFVPVLISDFAKHPTVAQFPRFAAIWIGLMVITLGLEWVIRRYAERLAKSFVPFFRQTMFRRVHDLPVTTLIEHHSGKTLSLVNEVAGGLSQVTFDLFWNMSQAVITVVLFFVITARQSAGLAALNFGIFSAFLIIGLALSRKIVPLSQHLNLARAAFMEKYVDFMANILTVKRLGIRPYADKTLDRRFEKIDEAVIGYQQFHAQRWALLHALTTLAYLVTIGALLYQVANGSLSIAILILFLAVFSMVRGYVTRLTENARYLMEVDGNIANLEAIFAGAPKESGGDIQNWSTVQAENLRFVYPKTLRAISIPSFSLHRGDHILVTGKSGEGKSTLLNLLNRSFDPPEGVLTIDGQPMTSIHPDLWRRHIATISQDIDLFNTSLRDNLVLDKEVSDHDIRELLVSVDLGAWAESLPDGLETKIGEKGVRLSAGQKQRVNIARGLLLNRELYLFDEPTSHLDPETAQRVAGTIKRFLETKTAIIVSHHDLFSDWPTKRYEMVHHTLRPLTENKHNL